MNKPTSKEISRCQQPLCIGVAIVFVMMVIFGCGDGKKEQTASNDRVDTTEVPDQEAGLKQGETLRVEGKDVRLRQSPSIKGQILLSLNTGDEGEVLEVGTMEYINDMYDYWYKVRIREKEGWIYGHFTSKRRANQVKAPSWKFQTAYEKNVLKLSLDDINTTFRNVDFKPNTAKFKEKVETSKEMEYCGESALPKMTTKHYGRSSYEMVVYECGYIGNYEILDEGYILSNNVKIGMTKAKVFDLLGLTYYCNTDIRSLVISVFGGCAETETTYVFEDDVLKEVKQSGSSC